MSSRGGIFKNLSFVRPPFLIGLSPNATLQDWLSGQGVKIADGSFQESVPSAIGQVVKFLPDKDCFVAKKRDTARLAMDGAAA